MPRIRGAGPLCGGALAYEFWYMRGYFDEGFVREAHARLDAMLREDGVVVDG